MGESNAIVQESELLEMRKNLPKIVEATTSRDKRTRDKYVCPFCGSGKQSGHGHDGALKIYSDTNKFYCFSCHASGNVFDYVGLLYGLRNFQDQIGKVREMTGDFSTADSIRYVESNESKKKRDFRSYLRDCENALKGSPGIEYLHQRGFTDKTIADFHMGYDRKYGGITIPYPGKNYYALRYMNPRSHRYYKPLGEIEPLFVGGDTTSKRWLISEGQLDVISLLQAGAVSACAFGGSGFRKLTELQAEKVIIVSDADGPGRKTAKEVSIFLQEQGIAVEIVEPPKPFKDTNEILSKNPALLRELVTEWEQKLSQPSISLKPEAFTDLNESELLMSLYGGQLRFSRATRWIRFTGLRWEESDEKAREVVHDLLKRQLDDAKKLLADARIRYDQAVEMGDKVAEKTAYKLIKNAEAYRKEVLRFEATNRISAILTESTPKALIDVSDLDSDPYLLNTPTGVIDLRTGEIRKNRASDFCTKITACGASDAGKEEWLRFLGQFTGGDEALQSYLQEVIGMAAVGEVSQEKLLIAYGNGGNGKSTFFNTVARVLGDYAGGLSAECLTVNVRKNTSPEFAELRGKRLVIAAELQEGMRLDTATVKKLCSTDLIMAERKFKDPFQFRPSHSVVLFTNHLPKVGSNDAGTWDRLVVIPLKGRFRNTDGEILNYGNVLFQNCGGAILSWIAEGARRFLANKCKLSQPQCVVDAVSAYREDNDWLSAFIEEKCQVGRDFRERAGDLYQTYREYCETAKEWPRSSAEFKAALLGAGYFWKKGMDGAKYYGLKLREFLDAQGQADQPPWYESNKR